jgi:hypothetical protein
VSEAKAKKARVMLLDTPPDPAFSNHVIDTINQFIAGALTDQGLEVITSHDITAALGVERQKQLLGCAESSCLAELGGAMGVDYIVYATIGVLDANTGVTLSLVDNKGQPVQLKRKLVAGRSASDLLKALEEMVPPLVVSIRPAASLAPPTDASLSSSASAGGLMASSAAPAAESHTGAMVALGVGAAGLFMGLSLGQYGTYNSDFKAGKTSSLSGDKSAMTTDAAVAWGALGVGVISAAVGTYLWLSDSGGGS